MDVFDARPCTLGEGPLWHPLRGELLWFDILERRLMSKSEVWQFDEYVSAAGWIDVDTLLMASASGLWHLDLRDGSRALLTPLEADDPVTRSNDGRADPYGGFWIGTMGLKAEVGKGSIYRYYRGELRKLHDGFSVTNAICFSPDGLWAYFADTPTQRIMRQPLSQKDGWPSGDPEVFVDLTAPGLNPDGAVVDSAGNLWNAQWEAGQVACYGPNGLIDVVKLAGRKSTCPAFGGPDLKTLFCTSGAEGLNGEGEGLTYHTRLDVAGQREHQVIL